MDKEKQKIKKNRRKLISLILAAAVSVWMYVFVYRSETEPPTKSERTNRGAALYTLEEQLDVLSDCPWAKIWEEAPDGGTYIIPGLNATRTLRTEEGSLLETCTSMTPQSLAITDKYVFIGAYCHTKTHNSVIYMLNKETHKFIKEIILPGDPHVGGMAYDAEHEILWYSSNITGVAQAVSVTMEELEAYDFYESHLPIAIRQEISLYGIVRDSFMTYYEGCLYVGCFNQFFKSSIARYPVDEEGNLTSELDRELGMEFAMAMPLDYATISERAQGMAFYQDKLLLSHSFGMMPSRLVVYEQSDEQLYINENSARSYYFPERMEQIVVEEDNLYILFESAAYAYRRSSANIVDRVWRLSLTELEKSDF